jgi:anti-sigma B factor antagonist
MPTAFRDIGLQLLQMWEEAEAYCREGIELLTLAAPPEASAFRRWFVGEFARQMAGEAPMSWPEYAAANFDTDGAPEIDTDADTDQPDEGEVALLVLRGDIDLETAPGVRVALQRLRDGGARTIVVDAEEVGFLDSVGISVLIAARERLVNDGGELIVRSPSSPVRRTLQIAGLSGIFHIGVDTP